MFINIFKEKTKKNCTIFVGMAPPHSKIPKFGSLPDLSAMISFADLYNAEKIANTKLKRELGNLKKKFSKLQKDQYVLMNRLAAKPIKKAQHHISVQAKPKQSSMQTQASPHKTETTSTESQTIAENIVISTQTTINENIDATTQTEDSNLSTIIEAREPSQLSSAGVQSSGENSQSSSSSSIKVKEMKCEHCEYTTSHSGHFSVHKAEGCKKAVAVKDVNCPICCRSFTHNNLRAHLRQYLKDSSKSKNGHEHYTPEDHQKLLEKVKMYKMQSK